MKVINKVDFHISISPILFYKSLKANSGSFPKIQGQVLPPLLTPLKQTPSGTFALSHIPSVSMKATSQALPHDPKRNWQHRPCQPSHYLPSNKLYGPQITNPATPWSWGSLCSVSSRPLLSQARQPVVINIVVHNRKTDFSLFCRFRIYELELHMCLRFVS